MGVEWKDGVGKRTQANGRYSFVAKYRDRDGIQRMPVLDGVQSWKAAHAARAKLVEEAMNGIAPGVVTFGDWAAIWLELIEQSERRPASLRAYRSRVNVHLVPTFGHLRLRDVTPGRVQQWLDANPEMEPATQAAILGCLSGTMKAAALRGHCQSVDFAALERKRLRPREVRYLTMPELERFVACFPPYWQPDIMFMGITGVRRGEHAGLLDRDVDLKARSVTLHQQLGERGEFGPTKANRPTPTIELFGPAIEAIRAKRELKLERGLAANELMFPSEKGRPVSWGVMTNKRAQPAAIWTLACEAFGRQMTPHILRHTAASLMINAGLDVQFVSRQLGHRNVTITLNVYSHFFDHRAAEQVSKFDQAYGATGGA